MPSFSTSSISLLSAPRLHPSQIKHQFLPTQLGEDPVFLLLWLNDVVTFTNTFGKQLKGLTLKAHYEGCYGKPMTALQEKTFPLVTVGETVTASFPQIFVKPQQQPPVLMDRSQHALSSIQIVSENKDVWFDFDTSMRRDFGLAIGCPKDGIK